MGAGREVRVTREKDRTRKGNGDSNWNPETVSPVVFFVSSLFTLVGASPSHLIRIVYVRVYSLKQRNY